jgi:hypothetical protein
MLNKSITSLLSALVLAALSITSSNAQEVNLGGFNGNVSTVVTHGIAVRASDNNCMLVSGAANDQTDAMKALIGGNPYKGNGGCNYKREDGVAATTTGREISIGSVASDDGRLNFQQGDVIDAGQTLAISFIGSNPNGVSLSLSGVAMVNPLIDINDVAFKTLSSQAEEHLENDFKLGNAYISAPVSSNVDLTLGSYVQSQGASALFPIGVNVVNSVSLPILRSPGAQLKDALLPQAMVGASMYLDGGVTLDAYYQLEQKEVELDAAGTFFGSDLVGVGNRTGIISAANVNENATLPIDSNYFDVSECIKGVSVSDLSNLASDDGLCDSSNADHLWGENEDGWSIFHDVVNTYFGSGYATNGLSVQAGVAGSIPAVFQGVVSNAGLDGQYDLMAGHASSANTTQTTTTVRDAFTRLYSQYPGQGDMPGLLYIRRAPDTLAKDSGQFGLNLTGYADNIGQGVDWGLYYNNSHSNSPRIRMLAVTDGYATDMFAMLNNLVAAAPSGLAQLDHTNGTVTATERAIATIATGPSVCFLANSTTGAWIGGAGTAAGNASAPTHLHDPSRCYKFQAFATESGNAAYAGATIAGIQGATLGAIATLSFANAGRYQLYYPEDIQTFGASASTTINGWAVAGEVAFRPDFPMQIAPSDLTMNLIDSTYGTAVQSSVAALAVSALTPMVATTKWSAAPNCDISSATGTSSLAMSGYSVCDGTAEFDAWSVTANFVKTFTASEPFVANAGADGATLLVDFGYVGVPDLNYAQGVVASGQFQGAHDVQRNGCLNAFSSYALTIQSNGLFGDDYCEQNAGPDKDAMAYKIRGSLTYNNFNNSAWSFSPSFGFNHDFSGNAPSSLGGFVEDRMSASATARFTNGGMTTSISYQMEMGDELVNSSTDKDYVSANFSYAF